MAAVIGVAGLAFEARIAAGKHTRAICSSDGQMLATSLACAITADCCGLISFGIAGGLSPDLRPGMCVVGSTIVSETNRVITDRNWSRALQQLIPDAVHGAIAGVTTIIAQPEAKRTLYARTGALAVDNESHVVASVAVAHGLPMAAVRVIMDPATRELPGAALAAVRSNGTIDLAALIRSMMREPGELPMLLRTALDALIGFSALLRCRQLLGPGLGLPSLRVREPGLRPSMEIPEAGDLLPGRSARGGFMMDNIAELFARRERDRYALHIRHLDEQMVKVLGTIGYDVGFCRGQGQYLYDREGGRYLDLLSGFGVFAIGRNHPALREALKSVLDSELPNLVQMDVSTLAGILAERLLARVPYLDKVFFANSGAESVEAAIKFARAATGRAGIVYCEHAFHGLSYGALSLNGDDMFRGGFGPLLPDCVRIPFNNLFALEKALRARTMAAFIVEPIQGKGVNLPDDDYLKSAADLCRRYGTLFVADEIQTGLGRTGRFLAVEHWNVEPDMVLLAKSLSGGHVPVSAVLTRRHIFEKVFDRMDRAVVHGSTFGKNDLAMAAGIATLDVLTSERLIENAAQTGEYLLCGLAAMRARHELLSDVRGKGLMIGIEFGSPRSLKLKASWNVLEAANRGLFCQLITIPLFRDHKILSQVAGHASHTIKLLPALVISNADCEWILNAFDSVIAASHRVPGAIWSLGKTLAGHAMRASG